MLPNLQHLAKATRIAKTLGDLIAMHYQSPLVKAGGRLDLSERDDGLSRR